VVAKSPSLQEIHLSSAGVRWEFFQKLAAAMGSNQYCNLTTLDISLNFVEDRGLGSLATVLSHFPRGTRHLNLAHCVLTGKAVNNLTQGLITNKLSLNSLTYLNLAGNCLKEEVGNLVSFLAQVI
jgi:Ran GTPase-activating protein (RanGAP) involved in mRNA processing and transport